MLRIMQFAGDANFASLLAIINATRITGKSPTLLR